MINQGRRIAIDVRTAGQRAGGIAVYTTELCLALAAAPDEFDLHLVYARRGGRLLPTRSIHQHAALTPAHHRWEGVAFGLELLRLRPALIHALDVVPPSIRSCPAVITVHDLAYLHWPEILDGDGRRHYGRIHSAVANADHVIAVSTTTQRDLIELVGAPVERISVIPQAAGPHFRPIPESDRAAALASVAARAAVSDLVTGRRGPYFLTVGTIEPRKNLPLLLQTYDRLVASWPTAPRLVLAGRRGWLSAETFAALARLTARDRVEWLDGPTTPELVLLYNGATALLYPSRYEGFGLPALEAMACGTPVLASTGSALEELVGEAGWLLPPDDGPAWAAALETIGRDSAARQRLAEAGRRRAACFSWAATAAATKNVYRHVLANG